MKKYKVLIVDDEQPLAELIRLNFSEDKFEARAVFNAKDGLQEAELWHPNILILDVMMADMDGWDALSRLRANPQTAGIPVIMCTALDSPEDIQRSFQRGAQSYVIKPINFPKLMTKVAAILDTEELLKD